MVTSGPSWPILRVTSSAWRNLEGRIMMLSTDRTLNARRAPSRP